MAGGIPPTLKRSNGGKRWPCTTAAPFVRMNLYPNPNADRLKEQNYFARSAMLQYSTPVIDVATHRQLEQRGTP